MSEVDVCAQFLIPQSSLGLNRAEASLQRAQVLNPMVEIRADTDHLEHKTEDFFKQFDVVVVIEAPLHVQLQVNGYCRTHGVKFFAGDVWGMFGYSFADLLEHSFTE